MLVVAALLILPAAGAAAWSARQPSTYAAEVDLLHQPSDTSSVDSIERQLATHRVMLLRPSLIDDAATFVARDPDALAGSMTVEVVEDSSVLRIRVEDQDRDRARRTAAFVAERYVGIADQFAPASNVGQVGIVSPPTAPDEPTGPQPLRAAAAGLLVGVVLVVVFLALPRVRHQPAQPPAP